ncbi:hypothetical protein ACFL2B_01965 [Patescibacteria group bacterium]
MDNFFFGIIAAGRSLGLMVESMVQYQLVWGFAIGFIVSGLMHAFLVTERPRSIPALLFKDKAKAFEEIMDKERGEEGTYVSSYSSFKRLAGRTRLIFALSLLIFMIIILVSILSF